MENELTYFTDHVVKVYYSDIRRISAFLVAFSVRYAEGMNDHSHLMKLLYVYLIHNEDILEF